MMIHAPIDAPLDISRTRHIQRRCYQTVRHTEHQDLWETWERTDGGHPACEVLLGRASSLSRALIHIPERGNVWGVVGWQPGRFMIEGRTVLGFRGPYANGEYVFTTDRP